ncbi:gluconate 2-dehydrogenase subunit 3 family protein [Telluribacter sp. SYSU D00476]|uniref:gluconate 2-dehydrogenase subunit 3 family protein n=1 Tax=Telluribacter sp. SYSU D00476 TaxID=2811430 RepID=UPI001FF23E15|nr:gluconate 2-dehydrogenase subunit 3 family protein [Telluribacter sp. SYSU D00476]
MERRAALKGLATAIGGLVVLPSWASNWNHTTLQPTDLLSAEETPLLASVVDTIIPKTDTPGAKELGVDRFIQLMIKDCYDSKAQETLKKGLATVEEDSKETFGKSFTACNAAQRIHILEGMGLSDDATSKGFFTMVKGLTIQGYMSSEYVMTNITKYEMIPARWNGCVPVNQ